MIKKNAESVAAMPSIALAPSTASGSTAWLKEKIKEHGDTDPLKIESRRAVLSKLASASNEGLKRLQTARKANATRFAREIERLKSLNTPESAKQLVLVEQQRDITDSQYELLISQHTTSLGMMEALCLIVDSLTIRERAENIETGKHGMIRLSVAAIADETASTTNKIYKRMKKIHAALVVGNPMLPKIEDDNDEEEDDISVVSSDEILSADEREKIKNEEF